MTEKKKISRIFQHPYIEMAGFLLLMLLALTMLWFNQHNSTQAAGATPAQVRFEGDYRIGDGPWQPIVAGKHISATKGDVTLRGNFHLYAPDGEYVGLYDGDVPVALYFNHVNVAVREGENDPFVFDTENPIYGSSACCVYWDAYVLSGGEPVEMIVHNPHRFGNENAIDELLESVALWRNIDFERQVLAVGQGQRNTGLFFIIVALVLLGSALFSALLHIQDNRIMGLLGLAILSAGLCLLYGSWGVSFWRDDTVGNTTILGFSMMFYMLSISSIITGSLQRTRKIGTLATAMAGVAMGIFFLLPVVTDVYFYDTWPMWTVAQSITNVVLIACMACEFRGMDKKKRLLPLGLTLLLLSFEVDVVGTAMGRWAGGFTSKYVFFVLFVVALVIVLRIVPQGINAAAKARELETEKNKVLAELKESRISIMLSQIQPHFIYNTLGTIERMCLKDPQKAFELVRNFSLYLRGNFSELDSIRLIRFSEELKHVEYYVNIEKVRFPDMTIQYEVEATEFVLPALSVQPLVENAIKHGLMRLESGGTVVIHSYETESHFCVEVRDDGAGFDPDLPLDEKKHVGLRNIRGRLKAMVDGELLLESAPGVGTKAVIMIPKEANV